MTKLRILSTCSIQYSSNQANQDWYSNGTVISNMTNNANTVNTITLYLGNEGVLVGNGESLPITLTGSISKLNSIPSCPLHNVLEVPKLTKNLISISNLNMILIGMLYLLLLALLYKLSDGGVVGHGRFKLGLYVLDHGQ